MTYITLPTGRKFYANAGIIGINAEGEVYGGYDDGSIDTYIGDETDWEYAKWPPADRIALADLMIARWTAYKEAAK